MIFKSFLLGNLVSLCMKIINSFVVVGLYYGFITTFSIGPSYLLFLQARVMDEREEGFEKKLSATTGFITGQLIMLISIFYTPLHLALGRPHTITVLTLPYLLFHFFYNNHQPFFDYGSTSRNSMRNLSIQCIFLNNFILQLLNHFILPSSMLVRLVNIYMFRYNNKMLFVTSSFLGWLIGHILFMKWIRLVLVRIWQNPFIRSNKYIMSELKYSMGRILSILLFLTCVYYLGRIPSPILAKKLKGTPDMKEGEAEKNVEIKTASETKETNYQNDPISETFYLDKNQNKLKLEILKNKEDKNILWFEQPLVDLLFDYKRWNRPLRYIKNNRFENAVRTEMSQYFFYTCQSDGKKQISFTYPPSLLTFLEMVQRKISLSTIEKFSSNELYNYWIYINEQQKTRQSNEFINRLETLDKKLFFLNILEKRTRFCNTETKKKEYLLKIYDPFINGPYRRTIKKGFSSPSIEIIRENSQEVIWINKIHGIFFTDTNSPEFEQKIDKTVDKKSLTKMGHFLTLISEFDKESTQNFNLKRLFFSLFPEMNSKEQTKFGKFLFDSVLIDSNNKKKIRNKSIRVKTINKKVPQWSYKLFNELEQQEGEGEHERVAQNPGIRSRKNKRIVIFIDDHQNTNTNDTNDLDQIKMNEVALIRYPQQSDFRRDIIKGSMRTQRRKTFICELFQANVHSPLFLNRMGKPFFFSFEISKWMKSIFRNGMGKNLKFTMSNYTEKERKEIAKNEEDKRKEKMRKRIAEAWDTLIFAQVIRSCMLVIQSILRKYIILPSLIIIKNISCMLFFQSSEWSEDFKEWKREMHVKCTYTGVQLSETEFPKNWLREGIQIKILFPFCLKPCDRSKFQNPHRDPMTKKREKYDFSFLTVLGMEAELPFGSPRKRPSFFKTIFKKLTKKIIKWKNKNFIIKEKTQMFLRVSKELKKWVKIIIKKLSKVNPLLLFVLNKTYESNQKEKDSIINNLVIHESDIQNEFMNWTKCSPTEKKVNDLMDRTNRIRNQIEIIRKNNKNGFRTPKIKIGPNKRSSNSKRRIESSKNILTILKRRNARLIRKSHYFIKYFFEKIYINIILYIIRITNLNAQRFLESTNKIIDKYIYNKDVTQERIDKKNQTTMHFISTIKKSLYNISNDNNNSHIFRDLSSLSQTYVFYKLAQNQVNNLDELRYVLQYHGTSSFLKNKIRNYVGIQGIFDSNSKLRHKKFLKSQSKHWKKWLLRNHYQYNLSPIRWYQLGPQKWRKQVNKHWTTQNQDFNQWDLYDNDRGKVQLIHYKKQTNYEELLLSNQKENFKKHYKYDFLLYNSINYEDRNDSYIYESPLQVGLQVKNKEEEIYYNYNTHKRRVFDMLGPINNYLEYDGIRDINQNWNRKFYDCRPVNLYFKKLNIGAWINIDTDTNRNNNIKTITKNYQIIDVPNQKKKFNWKEMNEEILNYFGSNIGIWFFRELVLFYNEYKIQPRVIPIKLLLFNFNENIRKTINAKKKKNFRVLYETKFFELENQTQEQKGLSGQGDRGSDGQNQENLESIFSKQEKHLEEDYARSKMKNDRQNKQYKNNINTEAEVDLVLKKYFLFQLRCNASLNQKMINNIKVYCLLLRLKNPKEIVLSSIQKGEISLNIILTQKDLILTELIKKGILIVEPVRLYVKNDREFILYQTVGISLVHKNKYKINQRYEDKRYVDKSKMKTSIARHQKMIGNKDEKDYDLLLPENILSPRHRKEFRILIYFNSRNRNNVDKNPISIFCNRNNVTNCSRFFLNENEDFDRDKKKLIKLKLFLWSNYRLEDLTCVNRYWFDTNNGSRFSMLRIHMYPQVKIL
uniref:Protein TIC 214 n=1 Tax=Cansjera rheedei TaxID=227893 RepID=A0A650BJP7_9MAGN|nr:ycf1 [Cansjera rheedei]